MTRACTGGAAIGRFAAMAFQSVTASARAPDDTIRKAAPAALSNESLSFGMSMFLLLWLYATRCCLNTSKPSGVEPPQCDESEKQATSPQKRGRNRAPGG